MTDALYNNYGYISVDLSDHIGSLFLDLYLGDSLCLSLHSGLQLSPLSYLTVCSTTLHTQSMQLFLCYLYTHKQTDR